MEISKTHHKKAFTMIFSMYVLIFAGSLFVAMKPETAERLVTALFTQSIHINTNSSGLASIEFGEGQNVSEGLGSASAAGDRFNTQMNLISASEQAN